MAGISTVAFCDAKEEPKLSRAERRRLEAEALDREQNALFGANYSKMQSYLKQQSDQFEKQKKARDSFREEYKKVADSKKIAYNIEKKIEMDADTAMLLILALTQEMSCCRRQTMKRCTNTRGN